MTGRDSRSYKQPRFTLEARSRLGPDGSRAARQPCRGPSNADPAIAGFPLGYRGPLRNPSSGQHRSAGGSSSCPPYALLSLLGIAVSSLFSEVGRLGLNQPVGSAWDITNFSVLGQDRHARTLISAISSLFRQTWRTSMNRSAEAMTIFAVMSRANVPRSTSDTSRSPLDVPAPEQMGCRRVQSPSSGRVHGQHLQRLGPVLVVGLIRTWRRCAIGRNTHAAGSFTGSSPLGSGIPAAVSVAAKPPT